MQVQYLLLLLLLIIGTLKANNEKSSDEGNPYEFGFTIDGQQHRHEKKDSKGIIQGEFGFITADGIYHVTVYATDENGDFKILSMKNLRISAPLDGSSFKGEISPEANKYRKQANLPPIPSVEKSANSPLVKADAALKEFSSTAKSVEPFKFTTQPTVRPGCASCGYITTQKPQIVQINPQASYFNNMNSFNQQKQQRLNNNQNPSAVSSSQNPPNSPNQQFNTNTGLDGQINQNPAQYQDNVPNEQQKLKNPFSFSQINQQQEDGRNYEGLGGSNQNKFPQYNVASGPQSTTFNNFGDSGSLNNAGVSGSEGSNPLPSGQYPQIPQTFSNKDSAGSNPLTSSLAENAQLPQDSSALSTLPPVSVSDGVIHVGGEKAQNILIKDKYPGMQEGLPEGIEEKDITNILYKFHYTVGFHGHYEKGLKNGTKIGGYFVNGRDGISRVVTYVADENGYRPKVKFINLGLDSAETPKAETEKTFGLKSFEFVWYPL